MIVRSFVNSISPAPVLQTGACHLLGPTGSAAARTHVEYCLNDIREEVREIAEEAMEELAKQNAKM